MFSHSPGLRSDGRLLVNSRLRQLLADQLGQRQQANLLRRPVLAHHLDATLVEIDDRLYVQFCGNDYLGLSFHPQIIAAMASVHQAGATASALITGLSPEVVAAQNAIAKWKSAESACLLPSGYQANHAAVQTLAAVAKQSLGGGRFLIDKLIHASLLDAIGGSGLPFRVFQHNGMAKLKRLLSESPADQLQIVITESIFSMDGDAADLPAMVALKESHDFVLLLDEAHGSGVYGPNGAGYAAELGLTAAVDVSVVTLSKALGCMGGAVCSNADFCQAVANFGRAYVYSTGVAPSIAASVTAALDVLQHEPHRRQRVRTLAKHVRQSLRLAGCNLPPGDSPIIPIILGSEDVALTAAAQLREAGILVAAVRPPTVPRGSSRLRVTLCSEHTDEQIGLLCNQMAKLLKS